MADRPRVLFAHISPDRVSFVKKDMDILARHFEVREVFYRFRRDVPKVARGTLWADVTFSWFAWDQAAWSVRFSRMLGRKSIVIVGGFDVVGMPEISYGNLLNPRSAKRTRYAITRATRAIAVSQSIRGDAQRFTGRQDIGLIYHGFDSEAFKPSGPKQPIALTVGTLNRSNLARKGMETFVRAAAFAPEIQFRLVGKVEQDGFDAIKGFIPDNLTLLGEVDLKVLLGEMQKAAVYVQPSAHEGFGCSLAEAMLCGAVPVVTNTGAIPEVVGDNGIYVPRENPKATAVAIRQAIEMKDGTRARKRIADMFPLSKREAAIIAAVENVLGGKAGGRN
jgi:glycosyltransferase involved in cell wall biosynthesis